MALGFRLSSELIAGVVVGALLGWGFDRLLSTSPFGLIVFVLLGFIAGVVNVVRAAGVMAKQSEPAVEKRKPDELIAGAGVAGGTKDTARMIDPIEQFNIEKLFTIGHIGHQEIAFTNSSAYMFGSVALISLLMIGGVAGRQLVPGRIQSIAEISYEFVASTVRSNAGKEGMKFFPLVFSLFMFIAVSNIIGVIPYNFTIASHLIVTFVLAMIVFLTVLIYGFYKNGLKFFKLFVPSGIPIFILPLVVFIEVFSFFLRPISHSVRLFANMLAGHIALAVFASFIPLLAGLGIAGYFGAVLPLGMVIALTALELLVAFLQAYVFTILTCIYINDAIHPGH